MKTMIPLRSVAIASDASFIGYGYLGGMTPILVLHIALLPLNLAVREPGDVADAAAHKFTGTLKEATDAGTRAAAGASDDQNWGRCTSSTVTASLVVATSKW
jgi:hypothetical protein